MAKKKTGWIKWLAILVVIAGGVYYAMLASNKGLPVLTAKSATTAIQSWVEERGQTSLPHVYKLTMPVTGRVHAITLEEGDAVQEGQVVATLDTVPLQAAVAQAQARLDLNTYNAMEQTAAMEFSRWIDAVQQTTDAAHEMTKASEAQLQFSEWYTKSVDDLVKKGASPQERLLRAKTDNAQRQVDAAVNKLVAKAMDTISIISELGPKYVQQWLTRKGLETKSLQEALGQAQDDLERAVIKAPINGVILTRHVQNEQMLPAGAPLLHIGNLAELQITADILSQEAGPIKEGQEVAVLGEIFGDAPVKGVVKRVKPEAFTKISSLGVEQQRVPVDISFDKDALASLRERGLDLGVGYRVRVRIFTASRDNAVVVPRLALFRDNNGQWRLFTVQNGKAQMRTVEVGLMNDSHAQIVKGLSTGEDIIVSPPKQLADGDAVTS